MTDDKKTTTPPAAATPAVQPSSSPRSEESARDDLGLSRPDPRRNAYRETIARTGLEGMVVADRFVSGYAAQVARASVPLRREPDARLGFDTEALFGETVTILDEDQGWAWLQLDADGYVGYAPMAAFTTELIEPTHRVRALGTFVYPEPNIKCTPLMHLALTSEVSVASEQDGFAQLRSGGYVISRHLVTPDRLARDFTDVAERFVTTPYLWGGKTRIGIDCSGLVQTALGAVGIAAPRDSDMQQAELGEPVPIADDHSGLQRGDLVFWQGHVGIMVDAVMLVHANAHHMMVAIETLPEVANRNMKDGSLITAVRRLRAAGATS